MDETRELLIDVIKNGKIIYFELEITNTDIIDMTHDKVMLELAIVASKETITNDDIKRIQELRYVSDFIMVTTKQTPDPKELYSWEDSEAVEKITDWLEHKSVKVDATTIKVKDYLTEKDGKYFVQTYKLRA